MDRRRLLLLTQTGLAACSLALVVLALTARRRCIALFAIAFVAAGLSVRWTSRRARRRSRGSSRPSGCRAAIALNQLNFQMASIVGPALGGILIATVGLAGAYAVDVVSFLAAIVALLPSAAAAAGGRQRGPGWRRSARALRFVRQRRAILGSFVIDLNAMIFGMPTALFPVLALDVFGTGPAGLGLMAAAPAVGAFVGALFSGWVSRVRRTGRAILLAVWAGASRSPRSGW